MECDTRGLLLWAGDCLGRTKGGSAAVKGDLPGASSRERRHSAHGQGLRGGMVRVRRAGRRGFTLLELLLALALLVALLGAIGLAVGVQLRATDTGRGDVAQAQLARAILRQMADDLRGAIWYEPLDVSSALSGLAGAAGGASASLGSSPDNAAGSGAVQAGTGAGSLGGAQQAAAQAAAMEEGTSVSNASIYPAEPGLYGGSDWLEVDVSRLPRLLPGVLGSAGGELPSEVKTISWYLAGGTSTAGQSAVTAEGEPVHGLMRRELDRAVTQWASETGQLGDLDRQAQLVAAEVVDLAFRYFDGTTWVNQWDSASAGGLPWAVEIRLTLADPGAAARGDVRLSAAETTYRLVVALPLAEAASEEASAASGEEGAEPTSSDEGGQAGASAGGGGGGTSRGGANGGSATGGDTGISGSGRGR